MSELSTVAIKDGHRGHPHHHANRQQSSSSDSPDAERADRISRLAGLERVSTVRHPSNISLPAGASANQPHGEYDVAMPPANGANKERSTVGSASATGSVGGHTTWASGSDAADTADKMSEDQEMETSSVGGFSDEGNASLVGFGEGASSTVSGPVSTAPGGSRAPQRHSAQLQARTSGMLPPSREGQSSPMPGVSPTPPASASGQRKDARMIDGVANDSFDTSNLSEGKADD